MSNHDRDRNYPFGPVARDSTLYVPEYSAQGIIVIYLFSEAGVDHQTDFAKVFYRQKKWKQRRYLATYSVQHVDHIW